MASDKPGAVLHPVKRGRGGIHVEHNKLTAEMDVVRIDEPERVVLPMLQHIGAPCVPTVAVGDVVAVGQTIGDSDKFMSVPVHASISGRVSAIGDTALADGSHVPAVTIESDGEMRLFDGLEPPKVTNRQELITAVKASGLVGLGGAGFPTHVKLSFDPEKVDTLIVNCAECEPYITVDYRECIENSYDILSGVRILQDILGFKQVIIAVEDNKPEAVKILSRVADHNSNENNSVKLMTLHSMYPQGAEKVMVLAATGRVVPMGGLPSDVGCVVMNVGSVAFIARYLKTGKPLVSRSVTVSGNAVVKPMNVRIPIGMRVQDVFDFCGGFTEEPYKLIAGGPMMGTALCSTDIPMLKKNNALLAFSASGLRVKKERPCIHCGRCHAACPMNLVPTALEKAAKLHNAAALNDGGIMDCMECGSCAYSCPAGIPLIQYLRLGKAIVKEEGMKK